MAARLFALLAALFIASLVSAAPALASLADEVAAGQAIAGQLKSDEATCTSMSDSQFEHLGEYAMHRMVGSRSIHTALNTRMSQRMGAENADRMHELLGRSYAGCATGTVGAVSMGPGMMSGTSGGYRDWGAMMSSSAWSWMHNGSWQHMSQADWQGLATTMMGPGRTTAAQHRWSTAAALAAVLGAIVLGGLAVLAGVRRPWQPRRAGPEPR